MTQINPLQGYFRQIKTYVKLPSGTSYYDGSVLKLTDDGEVGVRAMTAQDELILKNPDALFNGEAVKQVLISCVDGLNKPEELLGNDVDALHLAIKKVSFNGTIESSMICPKCSKVNEFNIDLSAIESQTTYLEGSYPVNLSNNLTVFIRPFKFADRIKTLKKSFEQQQTQRILTDDRTDDAAKLKAFSVSFKELTKLTTELLAGCILRVIDESSDLDIVNNKENHAIFQSLLQNIDVSDAKKIDDETKKVNQIGVQTNFQAVCKECEHAWESSLELNPVNFSIES